MPFSQLVLGMLLVLLGWLSGSFLAAICGAVCAFRFFGPAQKERDQQRDNQDGREGLIPLGALVGVTIFTLAYAFVLS